MAKNYDVWCPDCGCQMRIRRGKYGEFYGCSAYPNCRNTMTVKDGALQAVNDEPTRKDRWND